MKTRIILTKTIEFPDDEASLTEQGFENTGGDPREVARQQAEWIDDGTADLMELLSGENKDAGDGHVVQWFDPQLNDWRNV